MDRDKRLGLPWCAADWCDNDWYLKVPGKHIEDYFNEAQARLMAAAPKLARVLERSVLVSAIGSAIDGDASACTCEPDIVCCYCEGVAVLKEAGWSE